ncbi:unnamed protein product, partial [Amoebophrya sp. A25]
DKAEESVAGYLGYQKRAKTTLQYRKVGGRVVSQDLLQRSSKPQELMNRITFEEDLLQSKGGSGDYKDSAEHEDAGGAGSKKLNKYQQKMKKLNREGSGVAPPPGGLTTDKSGNLHRSPRKMPGATLDAHDLLKKKFPTASAASPGDHSTVASTTFGTSTREEEDLFGSESGTGETKI